MRLRIPAQSIPIVIGCRDVSFSKYAASLPSLAASFVGRKYVTFQMKIEVPLQYDSKEASERLM
jgi:hypothetical protein